MNSVANKINLIIRNLEKPAQYIGHELNSNKVDINQTNNNFNFCFVYPDVYEVGFPNQAMRILCNRVDEMDGFVSQRAFLPKPKAIEVFKQAGIPLFSLETQSPLCQFDAIGITVSHELAATNVLEVLDFGGISVLAADRADDEPIIFGGGPMCCNPEPFCDFFDAICIGEAECVLPNALKVVKNMRESGASRSQILDALSELESIYVPSMYEMHPGSALPEPIHDQAKTVVVKSVYKNFANEGVYSRCLVPFVEVTHDRLNVEVLRGCARGCRFCQAGMMYRPVRERSCETICDAVKRGLEDTGYDEVSLTSLSTTDHSQIQEVLSNLNSAFKDRDIRISIPSQRLDRFGVDMAKLVAGNKKGGLTFAIEAGSQRLRDVINKNVCEQDLFCAIESSFSSGWNRCKLYFMIGLPTETDQDIVAIADLCEKVYAKARQAAGSKRAGSVSISASVAVFVPKAQTPFQWDGIIEPNEALRRVKLLKSSLKTRAIKISYHDPFTSTIESLISRGSRSVSKIIYQAWKLGAKFDSWNEFFDYSIWQNAASICGLDIKEIACSTYNCDTIMPWEHISLGINRSFLVDERLRAERELKTPDCTYDKCQNCGVCQNMKLANQTGMRS